MSDLDYPSKQNILGIELDNCHNWEMLGNLITANFQCLKFKVVPSGQIEI